MKRLVLTVLLVLTAIIGFCQVPAMKFLLQPDRTFKTVENENKTEIEMEGFSIGSLFSTALMSAQYHSGQPCSYVEGKSIHIHQREFYVQWQGRTFTYFFNFCLMLNPNKHKLTVLAPIWDHTTVDGRAYYWAKSDFFKNDGSRKEDYFLLEQLVNEFLDGILQTIVENTSR